MTSTKPSPQTWTLRAKCKRTTILLHIDPLQSLSSIKQELLKAMAQTNPDGNFNGSAIPQKVSDVLLAKPVDINNLEAGWESIEPDTLFDDENGGKGKGKAVAKSKAVAGAKGGSKDSAQGVGLRDGGVVAFKFRQDGGRRGHTRVDEDGDAVIDIDEVDGGSEEWDVVVPKLDEGYDALPVVGSGDEIG